MHLSIQQAVDDDDDHVLYGRGHDVTRSCVLVIVDIISLIWELRREEREGGREGGMEGGREGEYPVYLCDCVHYEGVVSLVCVTSH